MSLQLIPFMITIETDDSPGVSGLIVLFRHLFLSLSDYFYFSSGPSAALEFLIFDVWVILHGFFLR
jgi:hypothetical protein